MEGKGTAGWCESSAVLFVSLVHKRGGVFCKKKGEDEGGVYFGLLLSLLCKESPKMEKNGKKIMKDCALHIRTGIKGLFSPLNFCEITKKATRLSGKYRILRGG